MKTRPYIELSERDTILAQLRRNRKWTLRRGDATIRFWLESSPAVRVRYQILRRSRSVGRGHSFTVGAAVEACNAILSPGEAPKVLSPAYKPLPAVPIRQEWLPYKDAEL
jgi:hypothetical protein